MGIGRTARLLKSIFSKSLKTIPKTPVSEWADSYRMLAQGAAEPGRWHTSRAPYQKDIMDAFTAKGVHRVIVKSCSQVGKSDIMNNVIGRFAHLDPCTMMMIQPTLADGEDFSKSRIQPMIEATKVLKRIFRESKSRSSSNTIMSKYFTGGRLIIAGANAPSGLASRPIRILLCDEVDRFPDSAGAEGDPVDLAAKRTTTYWNRLIGLFSTPTIKDASRIDDEYMTGTQEEWQHQCPNCKEWHLLAHRQMVTDHETSHRQNKKHVFVKSVHWVCPDCGFKFSESEMRNAPQKFISQNPDAFRTDTRSYFVNCWTSPWLTWDRVMKEWLEAEGDPEREKVVYNTRFGESYERKGEFEGPEMFLERRERYEAELPDGVLLLTAAVDVQDNRLEYEVCGWGEGEECWGIVKGIILGVPDTPAPWRQLDMQLERRYYFKNGVSLVVARTFIDSGGHYTNEVYRYCLTHFARQRIAIKGSSTPGVPVLHKYAKQSLGRKLTVPVILLGTDSGKQYVMDRLSIEVPGPKYFHFPDAEEAGYDEIYFKGLISEQRVPRKKNGRIVWQWEVIARDKRNEPLDLRVYNLACLLSIRPDWERLREVIEGAKAGDDDAKQAKAHKTSAKKRYGCIKRGNLG